MGLVLGVNQISVDCFLGAGADAVYAADPGHLIVGFQLFGDAFGVGHLADQQRKHFPCLPFELLQVGVQLAAKQQYGEERVSVLQQELSLPFAPHVNIWDRRSVRPGSRLSPFLWQIPSCVSKIDFMDFFLMILCRLLDSGFGANMAQHTAKWRNTAPNEMLRICT